MTTKILYVCTYWGVRSQIAHLLTQALDDERLSSQSAGFESGTIGELPRKVMKKRGLDLPSHAPDTLFKVSRQKSEFDLVITLCNQRTQENFQTLFDVVEALFKDRAVIHHWDIPDFMSIAESGEAREAAAEEIVSQIEAKVLALAGALQAQHDHG